MPLTTTDQWLDEAEASLGRRLPASLRKLLKERNGGELYATDDVWEVHPVWDKRDRRYLTRTFNHLVAETESCREVDWYPADALAIAVCNADRLVLMPEDETRYDDTVYFWDFHGEEVERIANSVLDLVDEPEDWDE
ncbi:MAG: SMI1/KNR4 family protein [Myxococcales bacterium]|nr:SMI1/KNR4 family protein [Myxococcales bacterium]